MSGEALYERYKDALKRGHVASLRGRLEEALTAYAEAAAIAPERATPHTSAGTALMRRNRPVDALRHYAAALALAPADEAAHLGRAQALAALDRRPEAADAYDALAELRASAGRLSEAVDAARRGLELAEGRERRRTVERLVGQLRSTDAGEPGRIALERALSVLDGSAMAPAPPAPADGSAEPASASGDGEHAATTDGTAHDGTAEDESDRIGAAEDGAAPQEAGTADAEAPEQDPTPRAALDRDLPADVDLERLAADADQAREAGLDAEAVERLLDLAAGYRRDGRIDAALDACYGALSLDPDHVGLHLGLVELYGDRGWVALASEKLALLEQVAGLDHDDQAVRRVAGTRVARD